MRKTGGRQPTLRILPTGNLGNQMLQYMVALRLKEMLPTLKICGYELLEWGLVEPCDRKVDGGLYLGGAYVPERQIVRYLSRGTLDQVSMSALTLRLDNMRSAAEDRQVFAAPQPIDVERFDSRFVVINVRGYEVLTDDHPDYAPIPMSFIDQVIRKSGRQPVFLGQLGDDRYTDAIRDRYPDALYRPSKGALDDFETLRHADELVVAVSTFSWLAGWLSYGKRVHLPVSGLYNPRQRPDINLLPHDDARYTFYDFPIRTWHATDADFEYLWGQREHEVLTPTQAQKLLLDAGRTMRPDYRRQRARFAIASHRHHLARRFAKESS